MPRNNESYNIKEFRNVLKLRLYSVCRMHFYCSGNQLMNCNIKQKKIVPNSNIEDTPNSAISHFFPTPGLCHVPLKRSDGLPRHRCRHWNPFSSLAKISLGVLKSALRTIWNRGMELLCALLPFNSSFMFLLSVTELGNLSEDGVYPSGRIQSVLDTQGTPFIKP